MVQFALFLLGQSCGLWEYPHHWGLLALFPEANDTFFNCYLLSFSFSSFSGGPNYTVHLEGAVVDDLALAFRINDLNGLKPHPFQGISFCLSLAQLMFFSHSSCFFSSFYASIVSRNQLPLFKSWKTHSKLLRRFIKLFLSPKFMWSWW